MQNPSQQPGSGWRGGEKYLGKSLPKAALHCVADLVMI